jgi:hypothetical protein
MRKARLDKIAAIEDLAHGAAGLTEPRSRGASEPEKSEFSRQAARPFRSTHPPLPIFGDPSQPDEAFK